LHQRHKKKTNVEEIGREFDLGNDKKSSTKWKDFEMETLIAIVEGKLKKNSQKLQRIKVSKCFRNILLDFFGCLILH